MFLAQSFLHFQMVQKLIRQRKQIKASLAASTTRVKSLQKKMKIATTIREEEESPHICRARASGDSSFVGSLPSP